MAGLLLFFKSLWDKFNVWIVIAIGVLLGLWKFARDQREIGEARLRNEINKKSQEVQDAWTKIDSDPRDFDDAIKRLRTRNSNR